MTVSGKVLIVDDEADMASTYGQILHRAGYQCVICTRSLEVMDLMMREKPEVVLCDLKMPEMDGMEILERLKEVWPTLPVIMITGYATIDSAVEAMKKGASDYLAKPFSPEELVLRVKRVCELCHLVEENIYLRRKLAREGEEEEIVGESEAMAQVFATLEKVYRADCRVLITGESGTGKELVARAIHRHSARRYQGFFPVNCVSLTETLLESELFGHEKGAFTGAVTTRKGLFEIADGGTVFLDEIGETSPAFQAKLLRVTQENEFKRVGGERLLKCDVRILASTNKDIARAIALGTFREDLYYRLSVVRIHLPPLRERKEDIPLLADYFLKKYSYQLKQNIKRIRADALNKLLTYPWPGNVRELENAMERAVIMATGEEITAKDLCLTLEEDRTPRHRGGTLEELEKELIERTLIECRWNKTLAARRLGIGRRTLYDKAFRLGVPLEPLENPLT